MRRDDANPGERSRAVSWVRAARKSFQRFPKKVRSQMLAALEIAAAGRKTDIAKPMKGLGSGVFEIALKHRGDAWRSVYAVKLGEDIWVIHAFKKKSSTGIKTPKQEIETVKRRLRTLKEMLTS